MYRIKRTVGFGSAVVMEYTLDKHYSTLAQATNHCRALAARQSKSTNISYTVYSEA